MRSLGVDLVEYNIDRDSGRRDELKRMTGRTAVPVIDIDGTVLIGFNAGAIRAALERGAK